jgi:hypothetical protein
MTNPLVIILLGLALCLDYRLAGFFLACVGVFTMLTLR